MGNLVGGEHSLKISGSQALTIFERKCFKDWEEKND